VVTHRVCSPPTALGNDTPGTAAAEANHRGERPGAPARATRATLDIFSDANQELKRDHRRLRSSS
jgi:hypothetical protein